MPAYRGGYYRNVKRLELWSNIEDYKAGASAEIVFEWGREGGSKPASACCRDLLDMLQEGGFDCLYGNAGAHERLSVPERRLLDWACRGFPQDGGDANGVAWKRPASECENSEAILVDNAKL